MDNTDDIDIMDYLKIAKKHWLSALIGFLIVFSAVVTYTYMSEPIYNAKILVAITNQDQANFLLGSSSQKITDLEMQKIIIQSSNVMDSIYDKYEENSFKLTISNIKSSNVIEINVETNSPESAAFIANEIGINYVQYSTEMRTEEAETSIDLIDEKINTYSREVYDLDMKMLSYKNREKSLSTDEQMEYYNIQKKLTAKNKIIDYLLTKKEEAMITVSISNTNLRIIQYAHMPLKPIRPNIPLNLALGFILSLGMAFGFAMLTDSMMHMRRKKGNIDIN